MSRKPKKSLKPQPRQKSTESSMLGALRGRDVTERWGLPDAFDNLQAGSKTAIFFEGDWISVGSTEEGAEGLVNAVRNFYAGRGLPLEVFIPRIGEHELQLRNDTGTKRKQFTIMIEVPSETDPDLFKQLTTELIAVSRLSKNVDKPKS